MTAWLGASCPGVGWAQCARAAALALLCALALTPASAADHALLIGVADYPHLPKRLWLRAPVNDVALMRGVLVARGFAAERVQELVSRAGVAREPTRRNILAAMRQLLSEVRVGDQVVLYLAGHGSQQPQPREHGSRPTEPDGLDEVFLTADVHRWDGGTAEAAIPNALLDDEIGEWIDALVDRGATAWAFFDTCHAAGLSRGGAARVRSVEPVELGLPAARAAARVRTQTAALLGRTDGRVLAFAAQAHETTAEEWLPAGAAMGKNRLYGVFTFHLAQALAAGSQPGLQDLQRAVRSAYAREHRTSPTPQFTGDTALRLR